MIQRGGAATRSRDHLVLAAIAGAVSAASFFYFFTTHQILLYGDAVAHINIARRVFDSLSPGWQQLGTVWLPLPHLLAIPFIINDAAWQSGWGGSVVSMAAFVAGTLGVARLFWGGGLGRHMRTPGWAAALFFVANPNLTYLQSTAMTEPLSLALMVWAIIFFAEFSEALRRAKAASALSWEASAAARRAAKSLEACAMVLAAGMLTRYDHWFLAAFFGVAALALYFRMSKETESERAVAFAVRRGLWRSLLLIAAVAVLWLGYNLGVYGNPLEFATGPYSARAIAQRTSGGMSSYPGEGNLRVAAIYFFKSAQLNLAEEDWRWLILLAGAAGTAFLFCRRRWGILTALWLPLIFYPLSIAYGRIPIFMPVWWPFSYYNVRYGVSLLPAFAVGVGLAVWLLLLCKPRGLRLAAVAVFALLLAGSDARVWRSVPICLREARVNSASRVVFESRLAELLRRLPPGATLLMYTGAHVGALQSAGLHLARSINETDHPQWQQALAHPAQGADFVVATRGDPVWDAVEQHPQGLARMATIEVSGQEPAVVYERSNGRR